jgi:hypothetical protein
MNTYLLALFVHIVGAIGVFVGIGVLLFAVASMRRAQEVAQVRALAGLTVSSGNVAVGGVLLIGGAGLYMALTTRAWQSAWIDVATVSFVLLAPLGVAVIGPRIRALAEAANAAPDGPVPDSLAAHTHDPIVSIGLHTYVGVLFGIVFLMTTKPTLEVSLVAIGVATALGVASALPQWWAARARLRNKVTTAGRS